MSQSPTKLMRRLSQEVSVSIGTAHAALRKTLSLDPYRVTCQHELKDTDFEKRLQFCHWFKENLNEDDMLDKTFFPMKRGFICLDMSVAKIIEFGPVKIRMNLLRSLCIA